MQKLNCIIYAIIIIVFTFIFMFLFLGCRQEIHGFKESLMLFQIKIVRMKFKINPQFFHCLVRSAKMKIINDQIIYYINKV